ncbi:hypothetical protein GOP47_0023007 [Adiantum capillus-veneris]|uniref:Uncharacterized protein n=1 Tax=Adiantum capillus-veneris TaxID=13818 RepID=A0A9D4Z4U7_ADICA|nr:hypothetical protein GOP47_0023007 [Adiantum capillus-veneris]
MLRRRIAEQDLKEIYSCCREGFPQREVAQETQETRSLRLKRKVSMRLAQAVNASGMENCRRGCNR